MAGTRPHWHAFFLCYRLLAASGELGVVSAVSMSGPPFGFTKARNRCNLAMSNNTVHSRAVK